MREAAFTLLDHSDPRGAITCAESAIRAARAAGSCDFELIGRSLRGFALATTGQVADGMRELDGVAAAILGGEVEDRLAIGLACCYLIAACDRVRDYDRAVEWCRRLKAYCEQWQFVTLFAVCRTQYAAVCMWRGAWSEAERELEMATAELTTVRPGMVSEALVRLGELRRRQGRLDESSALFERAGGHPLGVVGRAMVAATRGDWRDAADLAERHLRQLPEHNRTERAAALELLVRAAVARGAPDRAIAPLAQLEAIVRDAGTRPLHAMLCAARGIAAAGNRQHEEARRQFEDAVDLFSRSGATYERAVVMLDLADVLLQLGRAESAAREAAHVMSLLTTLDAPAERHRAQQLIARCAPPAPESTASPALTVRELAVLRLIADGLGNAEIAGQLGISQHTVHRHVANTLTKLGVVTRSAAVAHAVRMQWL